jgi:hypothetical protein
MASAARLAKRMKNLMGTAAMRATKERDAIV